MVTSISEKKAKKIQKTVSLSEKCKTIKSLLEEVEVDLPKFEEKHNKSAGIRIRKALQEIKSLSQDIRMQILTASK